MVTSFHFRQLFWYKQDDEAEMRAQFIAISRASALV